MAADWQSDPAWRAFEADARAIGTTDAARALAGAQALIAGIDVPTLLAPLLAALAEDQLIDLPFRCTRDSLRTVLMLHENPAVAISLTVLSATAVAAVPPPATIVATGRLAVTRILAGRGCLRRWQLSDDGHAAEVTPAILDAGHLFASDGRRECQLIARLDADQVTLRASLAAGAAPFVREFPIAGGSMLRRAPIDDRGSRAVMLLSQLRASGHREHAAAFDAATRDGDFTLRWAAMREWLMLDAPAAMLRLRAMALTDPESEVRTAAIATLSHIAGRMPCLA